MKSSWWVLDRVLLDRVFQPIANSLHEKFGIMPIYISQFFGVLSIVVMFFRCYFKYHPFAPSVPIFMDLFLPIGFLIMFGVIRQSYASDGRNHFRRAFFWLRMYWILASIYLFIAPHADLVNVITIPLFHFGLIAPAFWSSMLYGLTTLLIWIETCFLCLDRPPPRRFRMPKSLGMVR